MMLAFLTIRMLACYWVMPQCFHRVTLHSSLVATLEDLLTSYKAIGLLSNASKCSNILPPGTFSKGIRTSLRSPDRWWPRTCGLLADQIRPFSRSSKAIPHIPRKTGWRLLRRSAQLPDAGCCLCVLRTNPVHGRWARLWFWALGHFKNQAKNHKHVGNKNLFRYLRFYW